MVKITNLSTNKGEIMLEFRLYLVIGNTFTFLLLKRDFFDIVTWEGERK